MLKKNLSPCLFRVVHVEGFFFGLLADSSLAVQIAEVVLEAVTVCPLVENVGGRI